MNMEEAIKIIDCYDIGFYDLSGEKIPADKLADAFDMAIEALSESNVHNLHSGDLISREDAKQQISEWATIITKPTLLDKDATMVVLDALPSADAVSREAIMSAKFHPLPYTHITPTDADAESYKRGWNDALDAVADNAPSAEAVHKPDYSYEADMVRRLREYEQGYRQAQAEAVTNGRLIDADALSEKLCATTIFIKDGEAFQRMINDAPTVSAEAVQGEWKRVETRTYKGECTNCGFRHIFMDGHDSQYRFCPYCGAKMTKGGDTE